MKRFKLLILYINIVLKCHLEIILIKRKGKCVEFLAKLVIKYFQSNKVSKDNFSNIIKFKHSGRVR